MMLPVPQSTQRQESRTLNVFAAGGRTLTVTLYRHASGGEKPRKPFNEDCDVSAKIRTGNLSPEYKPKAS
jgi:hypothetical protein